MKRSRVSGGKRSTFVKVNEAAKHFSTSQMETVQTGRKTFSSFPSVHVGAGRRGGRGGEGREVGAQLAGEELSREFICSHGNPPKVPGRRTWELG